MKRFLSWALPALAFLLAPGLACAAEAAPVVNAADTSWMLVSTALVLVMTPGLAFFYAGMVRGKNAVSTLYQNIIALSVIGVVWVIGGFSLAFLGKGEYIGDLSGFMLKGVGLTPDATLGNTIPFLLFMAFQMMFAIITPALMTGTFAERVKFKSWLAILILWSLAVYSPVAHWLWSPSGWLVAKGAQDFAGGFVVHMTAGYSALVCALVFRKRSDFGTVVQRPYDVGYIAIGTALLWFGWFGFNAGSALTSGGLATQAFVNTFISAAVALLAWTLVDSVKDGKPTLVGGCIGVVAGLVAITPAAGYVSVSSAILIGLAAGFICNLVARIVKNQFKLDDTLDVFACHGIGGTIGVLATGLLGDKAINGANGLLMGDHALFNANLLGVPAVAIYSMVVTFVILKIVNGVFGLTVSTQEETVGLDATEHGERINNG